MSLLLVDENVHDVHGEHPRHCLMAQDGAHKLSTAHNTADKEKNELRMFFDPPLKKFFLSFKSWMFSLTGLRPFPFLEP
jgi:hypothetical protein